MTREYTVKGVSDSKGRPVALAWCRSYNATDRASMVYIGEAFTNEQGNATLTGLPDTAPVDILVTWGTNAYWERDVFTATGDQIQDAINKAHTQNTDTALGTQTENLDMGGYKVTNLGTPTVGTDAVTKTYADGLSLGGVAVDGFLWTHILAGENLYWDDTNLCFRTRVSEADAGTNMLAMTQGVDDIDGFPYIFAIL